MISTVDQRDE